MNRFYTVDELWMAAIRQCLAGSRLESRDGGCSERVGFSAQLDDPLMNVVTSPWRNFAPHYAAAELLWYLSGVQHTAMLEHYAPGYARFTEDGIAHGAYGWRWDHYQQLPALIELLRTKPNTRQAVLSMWWPTDLAHAVAGDRKDMPCTMSLQFLVRDGKLHCVTSMRSNDVWLGLPYDVFCFTSIQQMVAGQLGLQLGKYIHNVGSMHLYDRDQLKAPPFGTTPPAIVNAEKPLELPTLDDGGWGVSCEQAVRYNWHPLAEVLRRAFKTRRNLVTDCVAILWAWNEWKRTGAKIGFEAMATTQGYVRATRLLPDAWDTWIAKQKVVAAAA